MRHPWELVKHFRVQLPEQHDKCNECTTRPLQLTNVCPFAARLVLLFSCQIAEKERDRKPTAKAEPMNTKTPTLEEKVRFTYDLYRANKIDVSLLLYRCLTRPVVMVIIQLFLVFCPDLGDLAAVERFTSYVTCTMWQVL